MKPFRISDLKNQRYFLDHIRWDVTPKVFMSPRITSEDGSTQTIDTNYGYMLYVDLVDEKPTLIVMQLLEIMSRTVGYIEEVPDDLMREAMNCSDSECVSGMYPLTEKLTDWLKKELGLS